MVFRKAILLLSLALSIPVSVVLSIVLQTEMPAISQTVQARKAEADRLLKQGNEQMTANQPEAALPMLQAALKLYRDLKDRAAEGQTLKNVGNAYQALKQYDKAIAHQQQALEIAREIKDRNLEATALLNIGRAHSDLKDYLQGISYGQQALGIAREIKDRNLEAKALNNIGWACHNTKESAKAIDYYEQSLTVSQSSQNIEMEGKTLTNLGLLYKSLRDFPRATNYFKKRLDLAERVQNSADRADTLNDMCSNYLQQGDFENSIQTCQQALTLYRQLPNKRRELATLIYLGVSYQSLERYEDAISYLHKELLISQEINNLAGQAMSLASLGGAYNKIGKYREGIDSLKQGLIIARKSNSPDLEEACLNMLAAALQELGEYTESTEYAKQSLKISKQTNDFSGQITAIGMLLINYGNMGNTSKVLEYSQETKIIAKKTSSAEIKVKALLLLGRTYNHLADRKVEDGLSDLRQAILAGLSGQPITPDLTGLNSSADYYRHYASTEINQSIQFLNQALSVVKEISQDIHLSDSPTSLKRLEIYILMDLGHSYKYLRNPKAITYRKLALQLIQQDSRLRSLEALVLSEIGDTYFINLDFAQAIEFHQQSLMAARRDKKVGEEGIALQALGSTFQLSGDLIQAEKFLFEAARVSESRRINLGSKDDLKISFFEGQQQLYRTLEEVLITRNKPETALAVSERGRACIFIEQLRKRQAEQTGVNRVSFPSIQDIKQTAQQHNATLVVYSVGIDPLPGAFKQNKWKNLFVWIVQPTGQIEFRAVDLSLQKTSLVALINLTRQSIGARGRRATLIVKSSPEVERLSRNQQTQQLRQLHQLLIEPIASLLPTDPNQRVIFIPQGELFLVPFPALQDANGKYLIEKHTILTAPSIQVLDLTRKQAEAQKTRGSKQQTALVVGNPTMPKVRIQVGGDLEQLSNLSGAEKESEAIAHLLKTKPIIGNQATKSSIVKQLPNARLIHLATHGLLDDFKGLGVPGAIALAPDGTGKDNDGLLTSDEILDMHLNANLVVLSACDTGRGRITGDGVIGLSRSLITAGVPSIIVSLWKVPDVSTAFLMTEFYKNLQQNPDKAQALRQAMQATKQKYPDPLDWAAFTLIGEAE